MVKTDDKHKNCNTVCIMVNYYETVRSSPKLAGTLLHGIDRTVFAIWNKIVRTLY